jgi:hypothetical protein
MAVLDSASARYSLLGILQVRETRGTGLRKRKLHAIRPVVVTPGLDDEKLNRVIAFEEANEIRKSGIIGLPLRRQVKT